VIGLVQVGLQGHADRYTYLPQIGLCIAVTWLIADVLRARKIAPMAPALVTALLLVLLALLGWHQTGFWKNSETLWRHALAVTRDNDVAETNLGMILAEGDHVDEGIEHLQRALAIRGDSNDPHYRLSLSLIHCDLGFALARKGEVGEAERHLRESAALQPNYADAHYNLATVLLQEGQLEEGVAEYRKTVALRPDDAGAHTSLGNALAQQRRVTDAMAQYEEALRVAPESILALNNLAWILSASPDGKIRNGNRAVELAKKAVELSGGNNLLFLRTLAAAYAEAGRFPEALSTAQRALHIAEADTNEGGVRTLEEDVAQLKNGAALRDESLAR
jgi:tetratricopeptide (TPR) repeat protein